MPTNPNLLLAEQLALALASLYLKPEQLAGVQRGQIALGALLASVELFRQASGRPEGWKPSAADWDALIAQRQAVIDAEQAKIDLLTGTATTKSQPTGGGGGGTSP